MLKRLNILGTSRWPNIYPFNTLKEYICFDLYWYILEIISHLICDFCVVWRGKVWNHPLQFIYWTSQKKTQSGFLRLSAIFSNWDFLVDTSHGFMSESANPHWCRLYTCTAWWSLVETVFSIFFVVISDTTTLYVTSLELPSNFFHFTKCV